MRGVRIVMRVSMLVHGPLWRIHLAPGGGGTGMEGRARKERKIKGDDAGCFASALASVRQYGGVLEHPAASAAWEAFDLYQPWRNAPGGWTRADRQGGWTCMVDQEHYGHRAQKATWLYAAHVDLPQLIWTKGTSAIRLEDGYHGAEGRPPA